jgi:alpha-beta hydrolase superfamily lysophospholipase
LKFIKKKVECGSKTTPSIVEYYAVRGLSAVLPTMVMNNPVDASQLSRDPSIAKEYNDDPYVHTYGSLELLTTMYFLYD